MLQKRIVLLLIIFLNIFSNSLLSQSKNPSKKEITKLSQQAIKDLKAFNFEESLKTSRLVLELSSKIKDDELIATSYNTIAGNYNELFENEKAVFFYNKGLSYADKTTNDSLKHKLNNNLGVIYFFEKKEYEKGINYFKKALVYCNKIADTSRIVNTNLNIAWAYFDINKYEKGFSYLEFINKYHNKFGDESTIVALNMLNGMYYSNKGDNNKAEAFFLKAIELGKEDSDKNDLSESYREYSKFLFKRKDYKNAYENFSKYNDITVEIYNEEKLKKADIVGINLELDEYKRELDKIELEKKLQSESLKKTKIIVILFVIVLLVLLLLLYTLNKNINFKKRANLALSLSNSELILAKEKAEEASLLKTQFVSTISHELRTPLYGVIGITNLLLDEHKELSQSPYLNSLKFSARYLLSLVNDVLQINKIEESRITLESLTFNIHDEILLIKNSLSFIAKNNNNSLKIHIDPEIPEYLIGDKLRLSQILINLMSNALKFTKNGDVMIIVNLVKVENKSNFIEFQIKDNGVGIDPIDQEKIFDTFVQIGRNEEDYQGTGLGLSIVKRLLKLFGSDIAIESKLGEGTMFSFTIAFDYDPVRTNEIINNILVDLTTNQMFKILVVEDNKINQMITKKIIKKNQFSCVLANSGFEAIDILEKENFDAILMDINMPLMNGFETTKKIRLKGIQTPIIALTAYSKDEITEEAISAGMNDIIIKPFEPMQLFKIIIDQINKKRNAG